MSKITIDGTKPYELMTKEELDALFISKYGMTWDEFHKKYPPTNVSEQTPHNT